MKNIVTDCCHTVLIALIAWFLLGMLTVNESSAASVLVGPAAETKSLRPNPRYPDQFSETVEDLRVKVLGGYVTVNRTWYRGQWDFNRAWNALTVPPRVVGSLVLILDSITRNGVVYKKAFNESNVYREGKRRLIRVLQNGYRWEDLDGNWIDYDNSGVVEVYGDNNNVKVYFSYDPAGRLAGVSDHNNTQVLWYTYDAEGRLVSVRDYTNREVQYQYTGTGILSQLTIVTDVRGKQWRYEYGISGSGSAAVNTLSKKIDPLGRQATISRTNTGMLSSMLDQDQQGISYDYFYDQARGEFRVERNFTGGRKEGLVYNKRAVLVRRDINGVTTDTVSDGDKEKVLTDRNGNKTVQRYDGQLNLINRIHPDGSSATYSYRSISIPVGVNPGTEPPALISRLVQEVDENGAITRYEYDELGNVIRATEASGTADERVTEYSYDNQGKLTAIKFVADANTVEAVWNFAYDAFGNRTSITDPEGNKTEYTYDMLGNILTIKDGRGNIWTYTYDPAGNLLAAVDPLQNTTTFGYDDAGNMKSLTDPAATTWLLEYDARDNLTKVTDPDLKTVLYVYNGQQQITAITDEEGRSITVTYDPAGRPVSETDGAGNGLQNIYADNGDAGSGAFVQPTRVILPTFTRELVYDSRNQLIQDTDDLGSERLITRYAYDPVGQLIGKTNPAGNSTSYSYDRRGNLISVTDPLGQTVEISYDDRDNLVAVKDQNGQETRFEYDRAGRLVKEVRPLGQATTFAYDSEDNLTGIIDAKGQKIEFVYDESGRLSTEKHFASAAATIPSKTISYTYDSRDLLTSWDDGQYSAMFAYDDLGRKLSETVNYGAFSLSQSYTYYANGLKKTYAAPDGILYEYLYDGANRVSAIKSSSLGAVTVNDYLWLAPSAVTLPGGLRQEWGYTALLELGSELFKDSTGNVLSQLQYNYGPNRNLLERFTEEGNTTYTYDYVDRVTSAAHTALQNESFAFDSADNRLAPSGSSDTWNYNNNNELIIRGSTTYQYDANGNRIQKNVDGTVINYEYDELNRLVTVKDGSNAVIARYGYDPFDRRLWKEIGSARTNYVYSNEGLVGEYTSTGVPAVSYGYWPNSIWGSDPVFLKNSSGYFFYQKDHIGVPQKLISSNGGIVWLASYQAFGEAVLGSGSNVVNNLRFPGQYYDAESGLHYNWRRYYEPSTGRYLTLDPIGFAGGVNLYAYVRGNPVNAIDPAGECLIGGVIGGAAFSVIFQGVTKGCVEWDIVALDATIGAVSCGLGKFLKAAKFKNLFGRFRGKEVVQRAMSRAELEATKKTLLLRGGRKGTHYVSDAVNSSAKRARQRLALPQTPEVRVTFKVPKGRVSRPSRVRPDFKMPGGGSERIATGDIPVEIIRVDVLR